MIDEEHQARRRYKKDLAHIKPDLVAYNKQKAIALGVAPDALKPGSSSSAVTAFDPSGGQVCFVSRFHFVSFFFSFLLRGPVLAPYPHQMRSQIVFSDAVCVCCGFSSHTYYAHACHCFPPNHVAC